MRLKLARPQKSNALNMATIGALLDALNAAEADPTVQSLVLSGAGNNFCGGADVSELLEGGRARIREMMDLLRTLLLRFERSRLAIVGSVHGAARAGGLEILLACDAVVAARSATFGDAHLANGLLPAGGATVRLPRVVGWQRAKWLILSAEPISAETAVAWGLVTEVCGESELGATSERLARYLIQMDSDTFWKAKNLLAARSELSWGEALEAEIDTLEKHANSPAFRDGISSFLTKR